MPQQQVSGPVDGPIDAPKTPEDVKQDPYALPPGFEWSTVDVKNEEQVSSSFCIIADDADPRGPHSPYRELCGGR